MINLVCPDFIMGHSVYKILLPLVNKYPYIVQDNRRIHSIYGNYPGMIWAGGWINIKGVIYLKDDIQDKLNFYNSYGVKLTLTCTNTKLKKIHLLDTYGNLVLSLWDNNSVLVAMPELEEHIRKYFPTIKINKSIVATRNEDWPHNYEEYELVVLKRRLNPFLSSIELPPELKERAEISCNDLCLDNCPRLYNHYDIDSLAALQFDDTIEGIACPYMKEKGSPFCQYHREHNLKTYISTEKVNELNKLGYNYFKLSGRGDFACILETVVQYLIKSEYQSDVRQLVYHHILEGGKRNGN